MHPWKRFWKVDVDAAYYWDEPLKLVEASEAEAALAVEQSLRKQSAEALDIAAKELGRLTDALAERDEGFKGFIEETERLHKAEVYGLKTLLAEAQARIAELEAGVARLKAERMIRGDFERRVDMHWITPRRSKHFTADADGNPKEYKCGTPSPTGLYPAVVVPEDLIGEVVIIRKRSSPAPARPDADVVVVNAHTRQKPKRKRRRSK